jgi:hypothetical protein
MSAGKAWHAQQMSATTCCCLSLLQINAASVAPITATQFGANRFFEKSINSFTGAGLYINRDYVLA